MKTRLMIIALALAAACTSNARAQIDDNVIDEGPSWTAGGHYTAELNLSANTLTLLPLAGDDQVFEGAALTSPQDLRAGVYMLQANANQWQLISTHPEGVLESETEQRALVAGATTQLDALGLSVAALDALSQANVGAIYIH
jgi:hypothetical protein